MKNILLLFLISLFLFTCNEAIEEKSKALHTIPFELTDSNNISIEAVVNEKDTFDLMFHTASNSVGLIKETTKNLNTMQWESEMDGNAWGGSGSTRSSANNTLEIYDLKWDSVRIWESDHSGPHTDGNFGPNLFEDHVVEINFDRSELLIHKDMPTYSEEYMKLSISNERDNMFIEGLSTINDDGYPNRFLLHSGFKGTVLYDSQFTTDSKLGEQIKVTSERKMSDSYANEFFIKQGEIPKFSLGAVTFEDMPVGFFEGQIGDNQMSVLGGELLKRFNIIFDSKREFIYLKSNQLSELPFSAV